MSTQPTDEDIDAVLCDHWPAFAMQATLVRMWLRDAMRASIGKWGTSPQPVREPMPRRTLLDMTQCYSDRETFGRAVEAWHGIKGGRT